MLLTPAPANREDASRSSSPSSAPRLHGTRTDTRCQCALSSAEGRRSCTVRYRLEPDSFAVFYPRHHDLMRNQHKASQLSTSPDREQSPAGGPGGRPGVVAVPAPATSSRLAQLGSLCSPPSDLYGK